MMREIKTPQDKVVLSRRRPYGTKQSQDGDDFDISKKYIGIIF